MDQVGDQNSDENWLSEIVMREALHNLNDREKRILNLRFFCGKTQVEVANEIGISQAQVSRLEKGAAAKNKKRIIGIFFPSYEILSLKKALPKEEPFL